MFTLDVPPDTKDVAEGGGLNSFLRVGASHSQIIDYNNCVGNHIHSLALFALTVPFIVRIRHKNMLMALIQSVKFRLFFSLAGTILNLVRTQVMSYLLPLL